MLEHVKIENFRCLRSLEAPLRPLTVLIGENDTGKSAFLAAVRKPFVSEDIISLDDVWRRDEGLEVFISTAPPPAECRLAFMRTNRRGDPKILGPVGLFHLPSSGISMSCPGHDDRSGPPIIDPLGHNVPALVDYLLRRDRDRFFGFISAMRDLVPGLEDVDVGTPDANHRTLDLVIEGGLRLPGSSASAGVRLLAFFAALAYHPTPPRLILVEEPEGGVHPQRLSDIMRLLRELTQGKHGGHAAQVILTTHSPYLLDLVDVEQDQVLVFSRQDDGSRTAEPADSRRLKTFLDEFRLGEVWFNEGEVGLVKRGP